MKKCNFFSKNDILYNDLKLSKRNIFKDVSVL